MDKTNSLWGGAVGKVLASLLVVALVCGALALAISYAVYGDVLLTQDEVVVSNSADNGDNSVSVKLRLEKPGFYLSDIKTERTEDKLMVKLYASVDKSDKYKTDSAGYYSVDFSFDADIKSIVQEGDDGKEYTLVVLNHKS